VVKGSSISKAMVKAGYSPSACKRTNKVTDTDGFKELIKQYLPEEHLLDHHNKLLNIKQTNYFVFNKDMPDDEIIEHLKQNGLDTVVIRPSDKGKLAFYTIDDANAKKSALDMAYKLKGAYAAEKHEITIPKPIMEVD
jgi:DNA-binding LacI/PurR family transcriptional regulator